VILFGVLALPGHLSYQILPVAGAAPTGSMALHLARGGIS
jgi:hypothetical protein